MILSMAGFMIKWALAAIPAFMILAFLGVIIGAFVAAFFGHTPIR